MITAKNNIIVKINSSIPSEYAIFNPVSGSFDIMDKLEYMALKDLPLGEIPSTELSDYLLERGYIYIG